MEQKISNILFEDLRTLEYISNALTVLETAMSPDNQAGILNPDIVHNQLWHLSYVMRNTTKSINSKVGAYHG